MSEADANSSPTPRPPRLTGSEPLHSGDGTPLDRSPSTVLDFWAWSSSDLIGNSLRGVLAEFIVGTAIGCIDTKDTRVEWDTVDLLTSDGIGIEVKSTAYVQSWGTTTPQSLGFTIRQTRKWDQPTRTYAVERERHADVYVFCVYKPADNDKADPLNVNDWSFYVVSTPTVNEVFGEQRTLTLSRLRHTAELDNRIRRCTYAELKSTVDHCAPPSST
ncbi:hypothetical protein [Gordonia sp. VNK21]|uniref:hypothetical protein n=1 Tax=Gordonia sp. VNK21 TaxID=3382483 RepID=UPI0038D40F46